MSDKCHTFFLIFGMRKIENSGFSNLFYDRFVNVFRYFGDVWGNIRASQQHEQDYKSSLIMLWSFKYHSKVNL